VRRGGTRVETKASPVRRGLGAAFALALVVLIFAACGGSAGPGVASVAHHAENFSSTGKSATGSPPTNQNAGGGASGPTIGMGGVTVKYSACMRAHGLPNFPDPNSEGQVSISNVNPNSTTFADAQRDCGRFSASGASGKPPSAAQQAKILANALKFSVCMRAHGVPNFPDPTTGPNGSGVALRISKGELNANSSEFQRAQKACGAPFSKHASSTQTFGGP
jgi:hypothetical protein